MSISAERYAALKKAIEQDRREADMAKGALAEVMKDLKEGYGFTSLERARAALKKERAELRALEEKLEEAVERLEGAYGNRLG